MTDPRSYQTYNTYDGRNRKITTTEAYGTSLARITTWHYEAASNIYQIDRPDGTHETKTYDAMNRLLTDTVPKDNSTTIITTFNYNPSGTINWVRDGNNHVTSFAYDASDQKIGMTYQDNSSQSWAYDDAHNVKSHTTVAGYTRYSAYDERNRKYADWWDANANVPEWRYFVRDAANRLIEARNGTAVWNQNIISDVTRTYDAANRLSTDQQNPTGLPGGARSVNYFYDADGKLNRMYASGGSYDYTFSYDQMGRFEKIYVTNSSQLFQYHYDAASNEIQRDNLPSGVTQIYPRDALNRMLSMDVRNGGSTLEHEGYTYDAMNRLTVVDWANTHTDSFNYYQDGELNQAQYGNFNHTVTFNLDKAGNRTSVVDNNTTTTYTPNTINQYTGVGASNNVTNDNEHAISAYNNVTYTYINDGRLLAATSGSNTYTVAYDALGRCVSRTLNGTTTYYLYDGEKPVVEFDSTGAVSARNLYGKGIDEILMRTVPANNWTLYYQQNHEGSVTLVTNAGGGVIERYRYDGFGAPTLYDTNWNQINYSTFNNRFLFTGREYAAANATGYNAGFTFYEYRARAYHPGLGRFMSEDPKLFDTGDYNLFRYCHNDPIDLTDPMGLESPGWAQAIIPGQIEWDNAVANFQAGHYLNAAGWAATMLAQQTLAVGTLGTSMRAQQSLQAARLAMAEAQASNKVAAVIGKYPNYLKLAEQMGAKKFNIPTNVWNKMTDAERWAANQKFLDRAIARAGDIALDKPIKDIGSASGELRKELNYLSEKGYELSKDGSRMVRSPQFDEALIKGTKDAQTDVSNAEHGLNPKPQ